MRFLCNGMRQTFESIHFSPSLQSFEKLYRSYRPFVGTWKRVSYRGNALERRCSLLSYLTKLLHSCVYQVVASVRSHLSTSKPTMEVGAFWIIAIGILLPCYDPVCSFILLVLRLDNFSWVWLLVYWFKITLIIIIKYPGFFLSPTLRSPVLWLVCLQNDTTILH